MHEENRRVVYCPLQIAIFNMYVISPPQTELEDMLSETRVSEEKAKKAMIDAARLADELRLEQENAQGRHSALL